MYAGYICMKRHKIVSFLFVYSAEKTIVLCWIIHKIVSLINTNFKKSKNRKIDFFGNWLFRKKFPNMKGCAKFQNCRTELNKKLFNFFALFFYKDSSQVERKIVGMKVNSNWRKWHGIVVSMMACGAEDLGSIPILLRSTMMWSFFLVCSWSNLIWFN